MQGGEEGNGVEGGCDNQCLISNIVAVESERKKERRSQVVVVLLLSA